ncbi:MAG: hypothetical protein WDW38_007222 [Sanguina aurantia]
MWTTKQDGRGGATAAWSSSSGLKHSSSQASTNQRACGSISAINSKTGNIYKDASLDLLPGGVPNTPVRRLSEEIREATSLRALASIYERNYYKTQIWKPSHAAAILMAIPPLIYYQLTAGAGGDSTNPPARSGAQQRMQLDMTLLLTMMQQELLQPGVTKLVHGGKLVQLLVCLSRLHPKPQHRLNPAELHARNNGLQHGVIERQHQQGSHNSSTSSSSSNSGRRASGSALPSHQSSDSRPGAGSTPAYPASHSLLPHPEQLRRAAADVATSRAAAASWQSASHGGAQHGGGQSLSRTVTARDGTYLGYGVGLDSRAAAGLGFVYDTAAASLFAEVQRHGALKLPRDSMDLLSQLVQAAAVLQPSNSTLWAALRVAVAGRLLPSGPHEDDEQGGGGDVPRPLGGGRAGGPDTSSVSHIGRQKVLSTLKLVDLGRLVFGLVAARQHTHRLVSSVCATALALGPLPDDPAVLTNLMWACARAKHRDPELCRAASGAFLRCMQLDSVRPRYIARFMWSCAVLGHLDTGLVSRVAAGVAGPRTAAGILLPGLQFSDGPAELLNVLWALSAMGLHCTTPAPASTLSQGDSRRQRLQQQQSLGGWAGQEEARASDGGDPHSSEGGRRDPNQQEGGSGGHRSSGQSESDRSSYGTSSGHHDGSSGGGSSSSSSSSSSSRYSDPHSSGTPPERLIPASPPTPSSDPRQEQAADGQPSPLHLPGVDPHAVYASLCSQFLAAKMWSVSNRQLALLAQALAAASFHSKPIWLSIGALSVTRVPDMSGGELSALVAAFATASVTHSALQQAATKELSLRGGGAFSGPELVTLLWALRLRPEALSWAESSSLAGRAGLCPSPEYQPRNIIRRNSNPRSDSQVFAAAQGRGAWGRGGGGRDRSRDAHAQRGTWVVRSEGGEGDARQTGPREAELH